MPIRLDGSARPILHIAYEGPISADDVRSHESELDATIAAWGTPFYMCVEVLPVDVEVTAREPLLAWGRRFEAEYVGRNVGVAFATSSRITRGVLRSLHWLRRPRYPWEILPTLDEAFAWCRTRASAG